jgi:serine/threonine protein kinase
VKPLYEFDEETRRIVIENELLSRRGGEMFSGPLEGAYGQVYFFLLEDSTGTRIAAKCPKVRRYGSADLARVGIEQVLYELEKTHAIYSVPWINRFFDVQIIYGWPFLLSRCRMGTLQDLVSSQDMWTISDRLTCLIQITRALQMARERGVVAHQDLKPSNIFFDDLQKIHGVPKTSWGMHFHFFVGDFGIADAFRDFAPTKNSGSRPYMAPEQYSDSPIDTQENPSFDCFALAVIAHELFTNGYHPIGVKTADVWPWHRLVPRKWDRAATWRKWADSEKGIFVEHGEFPANTKDLIIAMLSTDASLRPSLDEVERHLWDALDRLEPLTAEGLRLQINHLESFSKGGARWEHMDDRLEELRVFYANTK